MDEDMYRRPAFLGRENVQYLTSSFAVGNIQMAINFLSNSLTSTRRAVGVGICVWYVEPRDILQFEIADLHFGQLAGHTFLRFGKE